ncbi:DUF2076 domain-containing protein [Marinomonas rhizomae]|uniref:DUF2076 family protein n=1 Tax=Marinomonas rhizomae TaxID=491948 RepID=A0A366IZH7_9GAMM|nr:DUF2076 domain-containing protein [Marinomonas rhizomae]RBP80102.1 hypothetical protein DFP80_112158 [Marinomonas rhizomae]RNF72023.1 DUF2076 domain-containing protein [Marinomonas rhizomae]
MSNDASGLIDSLFERINTAEKSTGERDKVAETQINKHLVANPAAPYYMAQTIIMQEAALKQLNARVEELERNVSAKPSSGGFLSGLFGGEQVSSQESVQQGSGWGRGNGSQQGFGQSNNQQARDQQTRDQQTRNQAFGRSRSGAGSFLGGALQTAAGVAGGVVVGNMLMNMFSHHSEADMANVINEAPDSSDFGQEPDLGAAADSGQTGFDQSDDALDPNRGFGQAGFDQANMDQSDIDSGGVDQDGFDQGGFDDMGGFDDFGSDDFI